MVVRERGPRGRGERDDVFRAHVGRTGWGEVIGRCHIDRLEGVYDLASGKYGYKDILKSEGYVRGKDAT